MNILVLSSVYKDESLGAGDHSTNIVNSFVHDWVKQGHVVKVIHNSHMYPRLIHQLPGSVKDKLATKINFYISDYNAICEKHYEDCGAEVWRLPMLKIIPHRAHSGNVIDRQISKITNILTKAGFVPEVIVGHWASPQMELISKLKGIYNCRTAVVLHGTVYIDQKNFPANRYLTNIDRLGCRSKTQAKNVKEILGLDEMPFVCYSGVPDEYLEKFKLDVHKFNNIETWKFAYVGRLVGYKRVDVIIQALNSTDINWELSIVGEGAEKEKLEKIVEDLGCAKRVKFFGRIPRNKVMDILKDTHCFVMVSKGEIFGLVYLEAMAASCVAVGSKGEGIDGIIEDGYNGYLCEPADAKALTQTIKRMISGNYEEIAINGYTTALNFSDSKAAKEYLKNIVGD